MDKRATLPGGLVEACWHTPITGWREVHGRRLPTRGSTLYDLEEGPYEYAAFEFEPDGVVYSIAPGGFALATNAEPRDGEERGG